jgi:hypothetical protein
MPTNEMPDRRPNKVGTANIDIVDGERMQLIWEGVAEGRITEEDMDNPSFSTASRGSPRKRTERLVG